jgi:hypothetical protein
MAEPITWRNVQGPSLADASRPLEAARLTLNSGFDNFNNLIKGVENVDAANWQQQKENNTQDFLNKIYAVQGAEGYKALQQSGELDRMIAANGAQIDRAAARAAMDGRLATLQQRDQAGWAYNNAALDEKEAPLVNQVKGLLAQGKTKEAIPLIATLSPRNGAAMYQSLDARQQLEIDRKRGDTRFSWEEDEAKQKAALRPGEIVKQDLTNQGLRNQNTLAGLNIDEKRLSIKDAAELRNLNNTLALAQQQYVARQDELGRSMGGLATSLNLPVGPTGIPRFSDMTSDQIKAFDAAADARGMPKSTAYTNGDTAFANNFYDGLTKSGQFSPGILAKFKDTIRGSFSTGAGTSLVGNDAANRDLAYAQNQVAFDEKDADNWYKPGSANARRTYEGLAEKIDGMFGKDEREDLPDVQKLLARLAREGMPVKGKDGKTVQVVPSQNDILAAVRSTYEGWNIFNSGRSKDIEKELKKALESAATTKMLADGEESLMFRRRQAVNKLLNPDKK